MDQPTSAPQHHHGEPTQILPDLACLRTLISNVVFYGTPGADDRRWVLVDAGMPHAREIQAAAESRFGEGARPAAIILTHGHFDHIGSLHDLLQTWDVPVYAHALELPFLAGEDAYPPPDPFVGGGMALSSPLFPKGPFDFRPNVRELPADGSVPGMPGWRWMHTPGHTRGHVSLWRDADQALIAGDAFVTTKQESVYAVLTQKEEVHGPPQYFTPDWVAAKASVQTLDALRPSVAITGHGHPMRGEPLLAELDNLAAHFEELAVPEHGRYVPESMGHGGSSEHRSDA